MRPNFAVKIQMYVFYEKQEKWMEHDSPQPGNSRPKYYNDYTEGTVQEYVQTFPTSEWFYLHSRGFTTGLYFFL